MSGYKQDISTFQRRILPDNVPMYIDIGHCLRVKISKERWNEMQLEVPLVLVDQVWRYVGATSHASRHQVRDALRGRRGMRTRW